VKGLKIQVNKPILVKVIRVPFVLPWDKEERQPTLDAKQSFCLAFEEMEERKNGVKRHKLLSP
jgi:hypothetical protein